MPLVARIQARPALLAAASMATLPARWQSAWGSASMLSARMRCSESIHAFSTKCVATIQESAFDAAIMNMVTICCRASRSTSEPFSIVHIIFPGMAIMPMTLRRGTDGWKMSRGEGRKYGTAPHLVDSRHQSKAQSLSYERTTRVGAQCTSSTGERLCVVEAFTKPSGRVGMLSSRRQCVWERR